jgi:hypothetical protein
MTNEKWWAEEPYMTRGPYSDYYHFDKIVAEAERRGEVKAWLEIVEKVEEAKNPFDKEWLGPPGGTYHAFETCRSLLLMEIDEKRKQLRLASSKNV